MNREEVINCSMEIEEYVTTGGPRYRARLRAPQAGALVHETAWCDTRDEADRRVRLYWRELLRRITPDSSPFV